MVMRTFIGRPASSRKAGRGPRRLTFSLLRSYSFLIVSSLLARRPPCRDDPDRLIPEGIDDQQQSVAFRVGDQDLSILPLQRLRGCLETSASPPGDESPRVEQRPLKGASS